MEDFRKQTIVIRNSSFNNLLENSKFRSIKKNIENEIKTMKESMGAGQRIYKNLFEKRIKNDFRLYYFRYKYLGKTFVVLFILLISKKKNQQNDIDNLKDFYDECYSEYGKKIKEKFRL
jgi:hypothetical protein